MAKKRQRKYVCFDCKNEFFLYIYQTYKRFREHCPNCGSISIDLSSGSKGNDEIKAANEILTDKENPFQKVKTRKL